MRFVNDKTRNAAGAIVHGAEHFAESRRGAELGRDIEHLDRGSHVGELAQY